jgi:2'-5' RNA ligase
VGAAPGREQAVQLAHELRARAARQAPQAKITWIPAERLHLTVQFIGHAAADQVTRIQRTLDPPLPLEPFTLTLAGAGAFPARGAPRVLWGGVTADPGTHEALAEAVCGRLADAGVAREERPDRPHLSLARVREPAGLRAAALLDGLQDRRLGTSRVDAITLFESRLSPHGPSYVPLQRTLLS